MQRVFGYFSSILLFETLIYETRFQLFFNQCSNDKSEEKSIDTLLQLMSLRTVNYRIKSIKTGAQQYLH